MPCLRCFTVHEARANQRPDMMPEYINVLDVHGRQLTTVTITSPGPVWFKSLRPEDVLMILHHCPALEYLGVSPERLDWGFLSHETLQWSVALLRVVPVCSWIHVYCP
jgi:hypothetical protein